MKNLLFRFTPDSQRNFELKSKDGLIHCTTDDPDTLGVRWEACNIAVLNPWQWCCHEGVSQ